MVNKVSSYYFSPTGGTKKVADIFCQELGTDILDINLGENTRAIPEPDGDLIVVSAPVFGGRIPAFLKDQLGKLNGTGKKAVGIVVFGNRDFEDALLELKNVLEESNFQVVGAGAFVAQHSLVPEVGKGRPDEMDIKDIRLFATKILETLENGLEGTLSIPGNMPYKPAMNLPASPLSLDTCNQCGICQKICPTNAITLAEGNLRTDVDKCILCMACVAVCPTKSRILPPPLVSQMGEKLSSFLSVRGKNQFFTV